MIKLFGWERKMAGRLEIKRTEELQWLWKLKVCRNVNSPYQSHLIWHAVPEDEQRTS